MTILASNLSAAKRWLTRHGRACTLVTFTAGAKDSYEDPALTATSVSTYGVVRLKGISEEKSEKGIERLGEYELVLPGDVTLPTGTDGRNPEVQFSANERYELTGIPPVVEITGFWSCSARRMART